MKLDEAQRRQVAQWIEQGAKLSEIQTRLASEFGLSMTYMEVRFLVDDLKVIPKDPEPPQPAPAPVGTTPTPKPQPAAPVPTPEVPAAPGGVSVTVDQVARLGGLVSGKVKFSDGQTADWTLDQMGRLGLAPQQKGYRPQPEDIESFQMALQSELAKMGF